MARTEVVRLRIEPELLDRVKAAAAAKDRPVSSFIRLALKYYLTQVVER